SIPRTLITDKRDHMGVTSVVYAPNRDAAGMKSAAKLVSLLRETDISYQVSALPGDIGSKMDVNELWMRVGFDPDRFLAALWEQDIDPGDLALYEQQRGVTAEQAHTNVTTL